MMADALLQFAWPLGSYYFQQPWTLSGETYQFTFRWNARSNAYYMTVGDAAGSAIVSGIPVRTGRNLLGGYPTLALPPGKLVVLDASGAGADPGQDSIGVTHQLLYLGPQAD